MSDERPLDVRLAPLGPASLSTGSLGALHTLSKANQMPEFLLKIFSNKNRCLNDFPGKKALENIEMRRVLNKNKAALNGNRSTGCPVDLQDLGK